MFAGSRLLLPVLRTLLQSRCGEICKTPPKRIPKKEGGAIILAVVLLLPPAPCPGDAVFRGESESTFLGFQKRTQLEISG